MLIEDDNTQKGSQESGLSFVNKQQTHKFTKKKNHDPRISEFNIKIFASKMK